MKDDTNHKKKTGRKRRSSSRRRWWGASALRGRRSGPQTSLSIIRSRWARLKGVLFIMLHHSIARALLLLKAPHPFPPPLTCLILTSRPSFTLFLLAILFLFKCCLGCCNKDLPSSKCFRSHSAPAKALHRTCVVYRVFTVAPPCVAFAKCVFCQSCSTLGVLLWSVATEPTRPVTPLLGVFLLQGLLPQCFSSVLIFARPPAILSCVPRCLPPH